MENKIEIREAQAIPEKGGRKKSTAYHFEAMRVNESFIAGDYSAELVNRMNSTIHYYGNKLGMKFCLRKQTIDGKELLSVWRSE